MNHTISFQTVINRLSENNLKHVVLDLQNGIRVVVSERGGRVFGPFMDDVSPAIFWMPPVFTQSDLFHSFLTENNWNIGGERIWISPEVQFNLQDRTDWGSYNLQAQMDPAERRLELTNQNEVHIQAEMRLEAYNLTRGRKKLFLEQVIRPVADPLRKLSSYPTLLDGVHYAGYEQVVTLQDLEPNPIACEAWNLIQLNPGGLLFIPAPSFAEYTLYRGSIDGGLMDFGPGYFYHRLTGQDEYKIGYKAAHLHSGRMAYLNDWDDEQAYLLVRNFFNNPSAEYIEEPTQQPGENGHSVHVYNDGGSFGGFGEMEVMGQTIGGVSGKNHSQDSFVLWLYAGAKEKLLEIAGHLLGVDLSTH
jgi:hypothetical protein